MLSKLSSKPLFHMHYRLFPIAMPLTVYAPVVVDEASRVAAIVLVFPWLVDTVRGWAHLIMVVRDL